MTARPRIVFDTTGINELENGGSGSEPLMKALECGYEVSHAAQVPSSKVTDKVPRSPAKN